LLREILIEETGVRMSIRPLKHYLLRRSAAR